MIGPAANSPLGVKTYRFDVPTTGNSPLRAAVLLVLVALFCGGPLFCTLAISLAAGDQLGFWDVVPHAGFVLLIVLAAVALAFAIAT